ncbi:unnamed protein product [Cyprideis torosa]|uniref:Uncharacterized protein n=1 Tax=Cyprideis torosa TaxID=163714 RepID=A0A7R8WMN4_9CRUS|nr:unnamed protein product [Cyprideis torosa]CAG0905463.1 unnamed protein product [Cyprideis torosa]
MAGWPHHKILHPTPETELAPVRSEPTKTSDGLDNGLLSRSLNFHGQQLTRTIEEMNQVFVADYGVRLDYYTYQRRVKELGFQERAKRLQLHNFIARNFKELFRDSDKKPTLADDEWSAIHYGVLPDLSRYHRRQPLNDTFSAFDLQKLVGDVCIGIVIDKSASNFINLRLVRSAFPQAKNIYDQNVTGRLPLAPGGLTASSFNVGDVFRLAIVSISDSKLITLSLFQSTSAPRTMKLGLLDPDTLDSELTRWKRDLERVEVPEDERAPALLRVQSSVWSTGSLKEGIARFKAGLTEEAFQCFNQALKINPECVEALTARGALFANNGSYGRAIEDFEAALEVNSQHQNARKYIVETLLAFGKQ